LALERSQDRIEELQRERDESLHQAAAHEAEVVRLTLELEKSEADHRSVVEERQRERDEISRMRREHRDALEQLAALRADAHQSRTTSEDWRQRFDKLVADQRQQISALEEVNSRASRDVAEHETRATDFGECLYVCIHERSTLLYFLVDLLSSLQSLFYEPTPFVTAQPAVRQTAAARSAHGGARNRSSSCDGHMHKHSGCYACSYKQGQTHTHGGFGATHTQGRQDWRDGLSDLQELITALEHEIGDTSEQFSKQVHRIVDEVEQCAQVVRRAGTESVLGDQMHNQVVLQTCLAWVDQERRRLDKLGLPFDSLAPRVDWAEERTQYHAATRAMEMKFAQLMKLKRVMQNRQTVKKRGGSGY
jgi:hypothetical protein